LKQKGWQKKIKKNNIMIQPATKQDVFEEVSVPKTQQQTAPSVAMSESYNSAATKPVFSPDTQAKALAMFGSNDQRQIAANGTKPHELI
jgi:hypothetical protein